MNSRERVEAAINHQQPDRVPVDLGTSGVTGIAADAVVQLRSALGFSPKPPRVTECYGMMAEMPDDMRVHFELDTVGLVSPKSMFGFAHSDWKPWHLPSGAEVLVPGLFNTRYEPDGSVYQYPQGDQTVAPSGVMPPNGFYFDSIVRQKPIDEEKLNPMDNASDFSLFSEEDLIFLAKQADDLYNNTDKAILAGFGCTGFGDVAFVPGPWVKEPKGIRNLEEWYMSLLERPGYIKEVFEYQCEIGLENYKLIHQAIGNKLTAVIVSGTDFGTQNGPFFGLPVFRELYKPFYKKVNDWIHRHTKWKSFKHSCGGVEPFIPEFIECGFDILNPVQCSAKGMDPVNLKDKYGDKICFWGGGIDTQRVLPFGTPDEVKEQVRLNVEIFNQNGGFVFAPIHNIQAKTPPDNIIAMFEALAEISSPA